MLLIGTILYRFAFAALLENSTLRACFEGFGLNDICHLYAHSVERSRFKIFIDVLGFLTTYRLQKEY